MLTNLHKIEKIHWEEVVMVIDHNVKEGTVRVRGPEQKVGIINKIIDVISSIFIPFIYTLVACGILQGMLGLLIATGIMNSNMGTYKVLNFISDQAFASGALGEGVGIIPSEGKLYAPCDGVVRALFPSKHAIGIVSSDGVEILIHVGIDTVHMEGEGFEAHTENGRSIKKGDLLVTFSIDEIKKSGV